MKPACETGLVDSLPLSPGAAPGMPQVLTRVTCVGKPAPPLIAASVQRYIHTLLSSQRPIPPYHQSLVHLQTISDVLSRPLTTLLLLSEPHKAERKGHWLMTVRYNHEEPLHHSLCQRCNVLPNCDLTRCRVVFRFCHLCDSRTFPGRSSLDFDR